MSGEFDADVAIVGYRPVGVTALLEPIGRQLADDTANEHALQGART